MSEPGSNELSLDKLKDVSGGTKTEQESRDYTKGLKEDLKEALEKPESLPKLSQGGYKEIEGKGNNKPFSPILNRK